MKIAFKDSFLEAGTSRGRSPRGKFGILLRLSNPYQRKDQPFPKPRSRGKENQSKEGKARILRRRTSHPRLGLEDSRLNPTKDSRSAQHRVLMKFFARLAACAQQLVVEFQKRAAHDIASMCFVRQEWLPGFTNTYVFFILSKCLFIYFLFG